MFYQMSVVVVVGKTCLKKQTNKYHMEPVNVFAQPVKHSWKWPVKKKQKQKQKMGVGWGSIFKNVTVSLFTYVTLTLFSLHHSGKKM